ncbi:MAG: hypothetical protein F4W92_07695 [Gammaproteobacteria bacterium]|nr:hypothetical protein [Gammaproteobacteria bacterium]
MTWNLQPEISQHLHDNQTSKIASSLRRFRIDNEHCKLSSPATVMSFIAKSKKLIVFWLVLVGTFFVNHSVVGQTENECPVPPDTDPVEDPEVTAQQVVADETKLGDFTRLTRDRFKNYSLTVTSITQIAYFGCVLREDEGPWRTDSVYPILMTPFGRVVFHTKDMTLSGRLLNPAILATIYTALGVSRQDIADLRSSDPDTVAKARRSILLTLAREQDAAFDATAPIPGVRPGIPGAKGHVAVYVGRAFQIPLIVLGGFDLNASHVADEVVDYGDPSVTASDVVDRETLKQFVIEAGNYFIDAQRDTRDGILGSVAKVAMRDPNGPWRHGSVYIYILDLRSNIIFFHGANPNRFEFRPLIATVRDAVTGELILPQVIDAAKSSPEGGFVRYYFDDPTDDTDSADTPKVGYAREFTGTVRRQDGSVIPSNYIVGSGFYLTDPAVVTIRQNKVVQTVLPQVLRTMTASTVDAISDRIEQVTSDSSASASAGIRLGGTSTFANALIGKRSGSYLSNWLAEGSYFVLPLNAAHGGNGFLSHFTLWANADHRKLSDENMQVMAYDGNVTSANIGIDRKVGENLVGGVSMTFASGTVDYEDPEAAMGELSTSISSINPYLGWQMADNARVWAAAGFGWGEVEFTESTNSQASDLSQTMFAAGIDLSLMSSENLLKGGTTSIKLKGQSAFTTADVDEGVSLEQTSLDASRHRVSFKGLYERKLKSEAVITPSIEAGWRIDGGDGTTGNGLEVGAGLGYSAGRLVLKLNSQTLLTHSDVDDFEDWSFRGMIAFQPSSDGHGLSMSLGSSWGLANRELESDALRSMSAARLSNQRETLMSTSPWIHAAIRYDFSKPQGLGLWTSYRGTDHDHQIRVLQLGLQFRATQGFNAGLQIGRQESIHRSPHHSIELRGTLRW